MYELVVVSKENRPRKHVRGSHRLHTVITRSILGPFKFV